MEDGRLWLCSLAFIQSGSWRNCITMFMFSRNRFGMQEVICCIIFDLFSRIAFTDSQYIQISIITTCKRQIVHDVICFLCPVRRCVQIVILIFSIPIATDNITSNRDKIHSLVCRLIPECQQGIRNHERKSNTENSSPYWEL